MGNIFLTTSTSASDIYSTSTSTTADSSNIYRFQRDPQYMTLPRALKFCSAMLTYGGVSYFNWGSTIIGKKIAMKWGGVENEQFQKLDTYYTSTANIFCNFSGESNATFIYQVEILDLVGDYFIDKSDSTTDWRLNVELDMIITGVTTLSTASS